MKEKTRATSPMRRAQRKRAALAAAAIAVLSEGMAKAEDAGIMAFPAYSYNLQNKSHNSSLRIVGFGKLTGNLSGSGVFDLASTKKNSANFDYVYSELELHLFDVAGPMVYYELNAPGEDKIRFGSQVAPKLHDDLTFTLWMMPFTIPTESRDTKNYIGDPKVVAYLALQLSDSLSADTYWSWGRLDEFVYGEAGMSYMLTKSVGFGPQARHVFAFEGSDSTSLLGRAVLSF